MKYTHTPAPLDRWSSEFDSHWHDDRDIAGEKRTAWQAVAWGALAASVLVLAAMAAQSEWWVS